VNWDTTPKTANFTGVSGEGYFVDTTLGAITATLPATPAAGDIVAIADYANTAATNNITVGRNGSNIDGETENAKIKINGQVYTLVYVDATEGWKTVNQTFNQINTAEFVAATGGTVTTCGDYKIHSFTGPGTFTVTNAGNASGSNTIENLLIVAGGGGGGRSDIGAGGGAGGLRNLSSVPVSAQGYPITIGGGGSGQPTCALGGDGTSSSGLTFTSAGGGGGGGGGPGFIARPGNNGGSGGGGACSAGAGGSGNTPPVSPPQGNNGAPGHVSSIGGGGGGASAAAVQPGGVGGAGLDVSPFFGTAPQPFYQANQPLRGNTASGQFAGGGGGAGDGPGGNTGGDGGVGGGGKGSSPGNSAGQAGTINSGGGGGGGENPRGASGAGGSGIVIIRYKYQ
jgi:hypothetical protein